MKDFDLFSNYLEIKESLGNLIELIDHLPFEEKVDTLNYIKEELHKISPFKQEPVDCVLWVKNELVTANNYNPNNVAPPEMRLLVHSIDHDGYTQPIVTAPFDGKFETVDGFHRGKVGKEVSKVNKRVFGYLPVTQILEKNSDIKDRKAATIRHNRARGKHGVQPTSELVKSLYQDGWDANAIAKELGMELEEILRLLQFMGLPNMFKDVDFSKSWQ